MFTTCHPHSHLSSVGQLCRWLHSRKNSSVWKWHPGSECPHIIWATATSGSRGTGLFSAPSQERTEKSSVTNGKCNMDRELRAMCIIKKSDVTENIWLFMVYYLIVFQTFKSNVSLTFSIYSVEQDVGLAHWLTLTRRISSPCESAAVTLTDLWHCRTRSVNPTSVFWFLQIPQWKKKSHSQQHTGSGFKIVGISL